MAEHGIWMPIYWGDYLGKTSGLSCEEHGAYLLLIAAYWQRGKSLPDEDRFLSTVTRLSMKKWKMVRPKILHYFRQKDGELSHDRVEKEIVRSCDRICAGKAGANARWGAAALPPTSTPTKEDLNSFVMGKKNGARNGVTIQDPKERLNRFQKTIAEAIGRDGYDIVGWASDTTHPMFVRSLAICKAKARDLNKGWPHQWPK